MEWFYCEDFSSFKPLRLVLNGQAGTGKSVVLKTIASCIRRIFQYTNTCGITGPTGVSAFNINGRTLQNYSAQKRTRGEYQYGSMNANDRQLLARRFKHLLCLIIDERSMVTSKVLGTTECRISETIFEGRGSESVSWGGLPIVIMAGDDYQLPGIQQGAFECLTRKDGGKMTQRGRSCFAECAEKVAHLKDIRRVHDSLTEDKKLLSRLRIGEDVRDQDVTRLQNLHLDKIMEKFGPEMVQKIKSNAISLFWTNDKRIRTNIEVLSELNSVDNPTAIIRPKTESSKYGKGVAKHFDENLPGTSMFCINAKVALVGKNFNPGWGLHNGACGIVKEIVFEKGGNPNHGHQPKYVVVEFPLYVGPTWDKKNPLVRIHGKSIGLLYRNSHLLHF